MQAKCLPIDFSGRFFQKLPNHITGCDVRATEVQLIEPTAKCVDGVHFQALATSCQVPNMPVYLTSLASHEPHGT